MATTQSDKPYGTGSTDVAWYSAELTTLDPRTREVLEKYSHIAPDAVISHVVAIRDRAWKLHSYPCIGQFRFTDLSLGQAPQYKEVLARVNAGQRLLDMGCCFAQDIRRLVYDGAPDANIYGSDLLPEFLELGYELFRDKETLKAHLFASDIFEGDKELAKLGGTVDIIHASSFFHLFEAAPQMEIARRFIRLLKAVPGSLIMGRHMGNIVAGSQPGLRGQGSIYRHSLESWKELWAQIGEETGTKWRVEAHWDSWQESTRPDQGKWQGSGARPMRYAVWRE